MTNAYYTQKSNAKRRQIFWQFTRAEWFGWWEEMLGPNWFEKRGRRRKQFCMARKGDKGPYAPWNVECITNSENHAKRSINGKTHIGIKSHWAKLTEDQVREIYKSAGTLHQLGRKFGVSPARIRGIKDRTMWAHITRYMGVPKMYVRVRNSIPKLKRRLVIAIFKSKETNKYLAMKYSITPEHVSAIRRGKSWHSITKNLPPPSCVVEED